MSNEKFQSLLDGIAKGQNTADDVFKHYIEQNPAIVISEQQLKEHPVFQKHVADTLTPILEQWYEDGSLTEEQKETFQLCADFLLKLSKSESKVKNWLNDQTKLIDLTEKCLNEIGSHGYYIGRAKDEDPNIASLDKLLQVFESVQCQKLLDVLKKCITSRFYTVTIDQLRDSNPEALTLTQQLLLVTCPNYILVCDKDRKYSAQISKQMLPVYDEIFADFLPSVKEWTTAIIVSLIHPMRFILSTVQSLAIEEKKKIYEVVFNVLQNRATDNMKDDQALIALFYYCLSLLFEIVRKTPKLLDQLRAPKPENQQLLSIIKGLAKNERDKIRLKALELESLLVPEEEFLTDENKEKVTKFYLDKFHDALGKGRNDKVDEVLVGLRDLVQNDEVKLEVMKQNGLPPIMNYAREAKEDPVPLEITYAMVFNNDAKKIVTDDKDFVDHVRKLRESQEKRLAQVAHGIMWKLEGEEKFKKKEQEKKEAKKDAPVQNGDAEGEHYDMMISYCWAQKELCHRINDRLEKDGFSVWLDRDEMHGSIVEAMAEAIEKSRFVLICMSSNYKKSGNCKAEAEYAFNQKSKIIPLMVEANYKPDGWLGLIAGSKLYIDFAEKEGEEFDKAYNMLIAELERNGLREKRENQTKTNATSSTTKPTESKPIEAESKKITTTAYKTSGPASNWTEINVEEFLTDQKLEALIPVCESMDGPALLDFYQACQIAPDKMYRLVNSFKDHPVTVGVFFKFLNRLKKYLPTNPPKKVHFQYNFVYPDGSTITNGKA